ncbi:MAG: hypothetical protein A2Z99_18225 [Treponema sp. GWB1_62_6]|nr:MAG: hypothetical protein A2Z99_18225 [Treponema sp. GWB1_62_6]OHE63285.1 MAG: hypothetical protein A2Y36_11780 [Treponema sp. GWA1_62_8]OHE65717.1 MAG: hypothetical protein A2001_14975 [Treponema sp. GWC1_61_84]OHE73010.1 MAG: hypothetical protein A2413_14575 [Treponema sp. RIFOXYC1_FULL_61_9]HCM26003.1 hypothetical protein [Treponema sp.]
MAGITILTIFDRISCFHSLKPFLFSDRLKDFTFTADPFWCLEKDRNRILIIVRLFIKPDVVDTELLGKLRAKYDRIAYFHDDAGGGIPRLQILPFVDLFYSKALLKDRSLYSRPLYGKELFSDYYHRKYGVDDPDWVERPTEDRAGQLAKLRLSWNIGVGDYPRGKLRQRAGVATAMALGMKAVRPFHTRKKFPKDPVAANRGLFDVHARIALASRPSIAYQRKLILERIAGHQRFLVGSVSQKEFNFEAAHSKIVLSPFGWGELCLRDYEAVLNGALLLKPDMSHLETWPDIFFPGETYVSFDWDATDLIDQAERYLEDETERKRIARAAVETFRSQLREMPARLEKTLAEIEGA